MNLKVQSQPLIAVRNVRASSQWYRQLLALDSLPEHPHRDLYERMYSDGKLILQLHAWEADDHPNLVNRDSAPNGHGVLLWFQVDDFNAAVQQARALGSALAEIDEPAVLIGNSLGGALCLHAAAVAPQRVRAVVGLSPAGAPLLEAERESVRDVFRGDLRAALDMPGRLYRRPPWLARFFARDLARHFAAAVAVSST